MFKNLERTTNWKWRSWKWKMFMNFWRKGKIKIEKPQITKKQKAGKPTEKGWEASQSFLKWLRKCMMGQPPCVCTSTCSGHTYNETSQSAPYTPVRGYDTHAPSAMGQAIHTCDAGFFPRAHSIGSVNRWPVDDWPGGQSTIDF